MLSEWIHKNINHLESVMEGMTPYNLTELTKITKTYLSHMKKKTHHNSAENAKNVYILFLDSNSLR